jgi:riboflavin synthase
MFTGLVETKGTVISADNGRFAIACPWDPASIELGASICCDGCCLTTTEVQPYRGGSLFRLDVSNETLSKTTLGLWREGRSINLERSLKAGGEMGGHFVTGHVDAVATVRSVTADGFSKVFEIEVPQAFAKYIAPKGSVALGGVSLTVNDVSGAVFTINIIPTTLEVTTFGELNAGDSINMEVDLIARYVARLLGQ